MFVPPDVSRVGFYLTNAQRVPLVRVRGYPSAELHESMVLYEVRGTTRCLEGKISTGHRWLRHEVTQLGQESGLVTQTCHVRTLSHTEDDSFHEDFSVVRRDGVCGGYLAIMLFSTCSIF